MDPKGSSASWASLPLPSNPLGRQLRPGSQDPSSTPPSERLCPGLPVLRIGITYHSFWLFWKAFFFFFSPADWALWSQISGSAFFFGGGLRDWQSRGLSLPHRHVSAHGLPSGGPGAEWEWGYLIPSFLPGPGAHGSSWGLSCPPLRPCPVPRTPSCSPHPCVRTWTPLGITPRKIYGEPWSCPTYIAS